MKKIIFIIASVLIIAGAAVGIVYDCLPDNEIIEQNDSIVSDTIPSDTTYIQCDSVINDTINTL